jgi:serine/threonine protein kinase
VQLGVKYEEKASRVIQAGRIINGKYQIEGVLGRGGMGVVARGRQLELDRSVAVKFLLRAPDGSRQNQRFAREGKAIAKMRSEHVVRVFDVGVEDGVPFIVMEHLQGRDLAGELEAGPLSVELTVSYVLQACEAIAEAHSLGIVHRDLKPSNLFVAEAVGGRRVLKVLDFGVSKWMPGSMILENDVVTSESSFIGTPGYVSPEQLTHPENVDERTDVWALGVVLYQCLSGKLPFRADSVPELCAQILRSEPEPIDSRIVIPDGLRQVIARCLCKAIGARYSSAVELARALAPFAPASARGVLESIELLQFGARPPSNPEDASIPSGSRIATTLGFTQDASSSQSVSEKVTSLAARKRWLVVLAGVILIVVPAFAVLWSRENARHTAAEPSASAATPRVVANSNSTSAVTQPPPPLLPEQMGAASAVPRAVASTRAPLGQAQRGASRGKGASRPVPAGSEASSPPATSSAKHAPSTTTASVAPPAASAQDYDTSHLYRH